MSDISENNRRIAKNTLMLYIRMFLMMAVSLYTSRVILAALGVEDFGLYNIVGGIVVLFSFINNAMVTSTQRFLNYELGRNNQEEAQKVFSASLSIHFFIAVVFLILAESVGLWFLNNYIKIPQGREVAANWVYQFSVLASIFNIIRTPYNAAIIAHEHMSFYAYVSIIEAILKLLVVYLVYLFSDRLISYSAMIAVVAALILFGYYIFCRRKFPICKYKFEFDKSRYLSIASFSWWSLFGSLANTGVSQGINIILNVFFGVAVNAAMGIANQVNSAIYSFVSNFQTAFNPQIVKSYAASDLKYFINLILNTSRYSFFLLFVLALPVYITCPDLLKLWLGNVPEYSVSFTRLMLLFLLIDSVQGPLWVSAQATGKIKNYQLLMSSLILLNLPITYLLLMKLKIPEIALAVRVFINLVTAMARVVYLNKLYDFPIRRYLKEVLLPCCAILVISYLIPYCIYENTGKSVLTIITSLLCAVVAIFTLGINSNERNFVLTKIKQVIYIK